MQSNILFNSPMYFIFISMYSKYTIFQTILYMQFENLQYLEFQNFQKIIQFRILPKSMWLQFCLIISMILYGFDTLVFSETDFFYQKYIPNIVRSQKSQARYPSSSYILAKIEYNDTSSKYTTRLSQFLTSTFIADDIQ